MNRLKYITIILFLVITVFATDIKHKTESIIGENFPGDYQYEMVKFQLPPQIKAGIEQKCRQKFFQEFLYIWKIKQGADTKAYAVLDNVYGKSMPITFLVIFDEKGSIINSSIVKYREPYGGGVSDNNWNGQFKGRNAGSSYKVGKDIHSISGATISVNSITKGIRKLAMLMPKITENL